MLNQTCYIAKIIKVQLFHSTAIIKFYKFSVRMWKCITDHIGYRFYQFQSLLVMCQILGKKGVYTDSIKITIKYANLYRCKPYTRVLQPVTFLCRHTDVHLK